MSGITTLIIVGAVMFSALGGITLLAYVYSLNNIKSKTVGDGQHGTARWMTKGERRKIYKHIPFTPNKWRAQAKSGKTPTGEDGKALPQGIVVGCTGNTTAMVDIQSFAQLEKNYGKEGGEIIVDNTQITLFGGFAPNSSSADTLSKALGSRTVMSGSVSRSKNDPSQSLQMMERPLLTPDELKSLPKGDFVVMKTGVHPMRVHLKLFFKWGIEFDKDHPYTVVENGTRKIQYANKAELMDGIIRKYHPEALLEGDFAGEGGEMPEPEQTGAKNHQPSKRNPGRSRQPKPLREQTEKDGKKGGSQPPKKQVVVETAPEPVQQEVNADGQT